MRARAAKFVTSAPNPAAFPPERLPEIAFAGRSNVGKSSLLNALVGVTQLARVSGTPGRTRALNWFEVTPPKGPTVNFVDLPGYGYAKVPEEMRTAWRPLVEKFAERQTLKLVVVLVDLRRGPEREELELFEWLDAIGVPSLLVCTKADKLSKAHKLPAATAAARAARQPSPALTVSAEKAEGLQELWRAVLARV